MQYDLIMSLKPLAFSSFSLANTETFIKPSSFHLCDFLHVQSWSRFSRSVRLEWVVRADGERGACGQGDWTQTRANYRLAPGITTLYNGGGRTKSVTGRGVSSDSLIGHLLTVDVLLSVYRGNQLRSHIHCCPSDWPIPRLRRPIYYLKKK